MPWNPAQYLKFADHRLRPAIDLLNRVDLDAPSIVYDLGAGTGNITELLADRWPNARVIGVDSSEEMLGDSSERAANIEWEVSDIGSWQPAEPPDLIFTNAALHWLPDHDTLFTKLMNSVAPGGTLAVQMPRNFGAISHTSITCDVWEGRVGDGLQAPADPQVPVHGDIGDDELVAGDVGVARQGVVHIAHIEVDPLARGLHSTASFGFPP